MAKILSKLIEAGSHTHRSELLCRQRHAAKRAMRRELGIAQRPAGIELFLDLEREMGRELALEILVCVFPPPPEAPIPHVLHRLHHEPDRPGEALPSRLLARQTLLA